MASQKRPRWDKLGVDVLTSDDGIDYSTFEKLHHHQHEGRDRREKKSSVRQHRPNNRRGDDL